MRLQGKVAVISGAASGQGAEEARVFAAEGARVVLGDVQSERLQAVVDEINTAHPGRAIGAKLDVADQGDWQRVVSRAEDAFGPVTVLVNNAGVLRAKHFSEVDLEEWNRTMNVNAWGQFAGIKAVVPSMEQAGGGSIVNIGSIANHVNTDGLNAYGASKGAVEAITRNAAAELAPRKIRVNSIHPGEVRTPMILETLTREEIEERVKLIPLGRLGEPRDIALLALFLASDESSFMTGSGVVIDGGWTTL